VRALVAGVHAGPAAVLTADAPGVPAMSDWVATREESSDAAREALAAGRGVFVFGEPGAGRTHFVQGILAQLGEQQRAALWLGDDLQQLDEEQAGRLAAAVAAGRVVPLATVALHRPPPEAVDRLWRDGAVLRIDLEPLDATGMLRAVHNFLDGPLDPDAVSAFVPRRSGGDLVVLQEAVREARGSGALVEQDGRWRLAAPIPPNDALLRLIRSRISSRVPLTAAHEIGLELVALVPELVLDRALTLIAALEPAGGGAGPEVVLEQLESAGVLEVRERGGRLLLRLRDPVIELILPQTLGMLRRARLIGAVVEELGAVPVAELGSGELIALARYGLVLGHGIDAATLVRAATAALRSARTRVAYRLAAAAVGQGGGVDAEIALAAAESQLGRPEQARSRLDRLRAEGGLDGEAEAELERIDRAVAGRLLEPGFGWSLPSLACAAAPNSPPPCAAERSRGAPAVTERDRGGHPGATGSSPAVHRDLGGGERWWFVRAPKMGCMGAGAVRAVRSGALAGPLASTMVVFAWNGTIVVDADRARAALNLVLGRRGLPLLGEAEFAARFRLPLAELFERLGLDEADGHTAEQEWAAELAEVRAHLRDGAVECLGALRGGGAWLGVMSSASPAAVRFDQRSLSVPAVWNSIDASVSDTYSMLLRHRPTRPVAYFVGDAPDDIRSASAAGYTPVGVAGAVVPDAHPDCDALRSAGATHVIRSLDELIAIVA
jgi:phosphoglycolate phosphatase